MTTRPSGQQTGTLDHLRILRPTAGEAGAAWAGVIATGRGPSMRPTTLPATPTATTRTAAAAAATVQATRSDPSYPPLETADVATHEIGAPAAELPSHPRRALIIEGSGNFSEIGVQ